MADTFTARALRGHTLHTPTGFIVFNEGKETAGIPSDQRRMLVKQGIIAGDPLDHDDDGGKGGSKPGAASTRRRGAAKKAGAKPASEPLTNGDFTATHQGFGKYEIAGPGVSGETVKGKAAAEARLAELAGGAPVE